MLVGQSCGWFLPRPMLWARDRRPQLRANPSCSFAFGTLGIRKRRPQTDPLPPHNDEAPHGLRRGWEGCDRQYHNQWGNPALARAVSLNNVATDRWAGFRASLKTGAMVFFRTVRNGFHPRSEERRV